MSKKAVVIGAGLAGLSAGYRLREAGFDVTVLEKRDRVGGRVLTLRRDGFVIDSGPDAMTESYRNYKALATELYGDRFVLSSAVIGLLRDGRVLDIDTRNVFSMVFSSALSWPGKIRFMLGLFSIRKQFVGVDSFRLVDSADFDTETEHAESYSLRTFGREITDYVIDPLIRLVVGSGAAESSRLGVLGGLVNWSVPLMSIKGGLDVLPLALAKHVELKTGVEVFELTESARGLDIGYRDAGGMNQTIPADVCVIATPHNVSEAIYPQLRQRLPGYSDKLKYIKLVSVSLAYDAPTRSKAYVVQVPTVESPDVLLVFMQQNKAPDRAPHGQSLITIYTDTLVWERIAQQSDEQLEKWARGEIEKMFPELAGHFLFSSISRWPFYRLSGCPGFWTRTCALLKSQPEESPVQLAGDLFGAGSMESAVTWGEHAARCLIRHHAA